LIAVLRREARTVDPLASDVEASTVTDSNLNVARSSLLLQQKVVSLTRWLVGFTIGLFVLTVVLGFLTYLALTKQG
jgi:ABC-type nitrate/sulfonate/bicarbonate transport system permease component